MQDEVNTKVVALAIRTGTQSSKVTAQVLKAAMQKFLAEAEKAKTTQTSKTYHGKQTIDKLMRQNMGLTNIEVTDQNIKSFERVAKKYNIDFALKNAVEGGDVPAFIEERKNEFIAAMEDDLNTADALAAIFMLVRDINTAIANSAGKATLEACADMFDQLTGVLGLVYNRKTEALDSEVEALIEKRTEARKAKDFKTADAIRDQLKDMGIILEDTPQGVKWTRA